VQTLDFQKSDRKNLILLAVWSLFLFFIAKTFRAYYSMDIPPAWDNLAYQLEGVKLARSFFEGDSSVIRSYFGDNVPVGYIFLLSVSYSVFGFLPESPYIVSALFGFGNLCFIYLISIELNVKRIYALLASLFISTLPNFIYNNFLQTRNDFALSFFILFFLYLLIISLKQKNVWLVFIAGIVSGIGTLFKLSAPGYFIWMYLLFLLIPNDRNDFMTRLKCFLIAGLGAIVTCGWYYIPSLKKILAYYSMWGSFSQTQYKLFSFSDRFLFYFKNFISTHIGSNSIAIILLSILIVGILLNLIIKSYRDKQRELKESFQSSYLYLIVGSFFSVILFLTLNRSFSEAGDTPVLSILFILILVILNNLYSQIRVRKMILILFLVLPISLGNSFSKIAKEKLYSISEFETFVNQIQEFRKKYGMEEEKFLQVFSHPVYNTNAVAWYLHLTNRVPLNSLIKASIEIADWQSLSVSHDVAEMVRVVNKYPFIIVSNENPISFGGEYFVQVNLLNSEIKRQIFESGNYMCEDSFEIGKSKLPIRFCINKTYRQFKFLNKTTDGWLEWDAHASYYSSVSAKFLIKGIPSRDIKAFYLEDIRTKEKFNAKFISVVNHSEYQYEILLPPSTSVRTFKLLASNEQMVPASKEDIRKLALLNTKIEFVE